MLAQDKFQSNFTGGELTPRIAARVDLAKYGNGLTGCFNMIPQKHGGVTRRPGSRRVAAVKDSSQAARLLPFEYSVIQAYVLELGAGSVRFFKDRGQITTAATVATLANGTFPTNLASWTAAGGAVWHALGMCSFPGAGTLEQSTACTTGNEHVIRFRVDGTPGTDKLDLRVGTASGGNQVLALTTFEVGWHTMPFTPGASPIYVQFVWKAGAPRLDDVAFLAAAPVELGSPYAAADLAGLGYTQSNDVLYLVHQSFRPHKLERFSHVRWSLRPIAFVTGASALTFDTANDYPGACCFHEDRLVLGGSVNRPATVWLSKKAVYEEFTLPSVPAKDDERIVATLNASQANTVRWLVSGRDLNIGTSGAEWRLFASTQGEALTPDNPNAKRSTSRGSKAVQALLIDDVALFVQARGRKLREFAYVLDADAYRAPDITVLAEHLTRPGIAEIAYQQEPDTLIWAVLSDGSLRSCTYDRAQEVVAWARHQLGGAYQGGQAQVESVAVIPAPASASGGADDLWLIVKRTVAGATVRQVEHLETLYDPQSLTDFEGAYFVDGGAVYDGAVTQALTPGTGATVADTTGVTFTTGGAAFVAGDVGREIRYRYFVAKTDAAPAQHKRASAVITGYASATQVTATIILPWPSLALVAASAWRMTVTGLTGLGFAEGESLALWTDNGADPAVTVAAGAVALPSPASLVYIGWHVAPEVETLGYAVQSQRGPSRGRAARYDMLLVDFYQTCEGVQSGPDAAHLDQIAFRDAAAPTEIPPALLSEVVDGLFAGDVESDPHVFLRQPVPGPWTLRALTAGTRVHE